MFQQPEIRKQMKRVAAKLAARKINVEDVRRIVTSNLNIPSEYTQAAITQIEEWAAEMPDKAEDSVSGASGDDTVPAEPEMIPETEGDGSDVVADAMDAKVGDTAGDSDPEPEKPAKKPTRKKAASGRKSKKKK